MAVAAANRETHQEHPYFSIEDVLSTGDYLPVDDIPEVYVARLDERFGPAG